METYTQVLCCIASQIILREVSGPTASGTGSPSKGGSWLFGEWGHGRGPHYSGCLPKARGDQEPPSSESPKVLVEQGWGRKWESYKLVSWSGQGSPGPQRKGGRGTVLCDSASEDQRTLLGAAFLNLGRDLLLCPQIGAVENPATRMQARGWEQGAGAGVATLLDSTGMLWR